MEELYDWVEGFLDKLQFENEQVEYRCCYTEKLIEPWKNPSSVCDVTTNDTATVVKEPVVGKNIQQIDNLLKKAKSVRSYKLPKPTDGLMTKKMNSKKKIKGERGAKEHFPVSCELTKMKEVPINENLDKNPCHKNFIPLEEAINLFSLPKELKKLDYLTCQLKQQKAFRSHFLISKPSKEEINFLNTLNGGSKTTLTLDAALQMISNITLLCHRIIFVLRTDYDSHKISSNLLSRENELILKKVDLITKNIINTCDYISNSTIVPNTSVSSYDPILDLSTLYPCKEILYESTNDPKNFLQNLYEIESLKMLMLVQKKLFESLKKVLEETILGDNEGLRARFLLAYKHVFGGFAQKPSVVLPTVVSCQ